MFPTKVVGHATFDPDAATKHEPRLSPRLMELLLVRKDDYDPASSCGCIFAEATV